MAAGYEARSIRSLLEFILSGRWLSLRLNPSRGPGEPKYIIVGCDGKPPLWRAAATGEKGTPNHILQAIVVGVLAGLPGYRRLLLDWWAEEKRRGHMLNEFMSASHWQHWAAAVAAVLIIAQREGWKRVANEAIAWFARDTRLNLRFWHPEVQASMGRGSTLVPHARTWGGWKGGGPTTPHAVKGLWSPMRDEVMRWVAFNGPKPRGKYDEGMDREAVALLTHPEMPWEQIMVASTRTHVDTIRTISPIYEREHNGVITGWWEPPPQVWRTPPTCYAVEIEGGEARFYHSRQSWPAGHSTAGAKQVGRAA